MIRTLDHYLFRELVVPFFVATVAVVIMFLANTLIFYSEYLFKKEIAIAAVLQVLLFSIPSALNLTLPVGITIASSLSVARMVRESEITAIRAAGTPIRRTLIPILVMGLLVSGLSFYVYEKLTPVSERRLKETLRKIFASAEAIGVRSNVLLKLDNGRYHISIGTVQQAPGGGVQMKNVLMFHTPKRGEFWVVTAENSEYKDGLFTMYQPSIWVFEGTRLVQFDVKDKHVISQRVSIESFFGQPLAPEQNLTQLHETVKILRERGNLVQAREYEVEYHNRFSVPFACAIFSLFAPVFSIHFSKGGPFVGLLLSIFVVFLYYNVWVISAQKLAKAGFLPPIVGAWFPNFLFLVIAVIALWRSE